MHLYGLGLTEKFRVDNSVVKWIGREVGKTMGDDTMKLLICGTKKKNLAGPAEQVQSELR